MEDAEKAALKVADYKEAVFQAANSALKDTVGRIRLVMPPRKTCWKPDRGRLQHSRNLLAICQLLATHCAGGLGL